MGSLEAGGSNFLGIKSLRRNELLEASSERIAGRFLGTIYHRISKKDSYFSENKLLVVTSKVITIQFSRINH